MAWPSSWEKCGSFSFSFSQACWKSMVSTIQPCEQSCKKLFSLQPMQQDDWLQRQSLWASKRVCETWRTNFQFYQLLPLSPIGCSCNMFLLPDHHLLLPWDESYATEISAKQDANGQILHWELDLLPMKEQHSRIEKESHHSSLSLSLSINHSKHCFKKQEEIGQLSYTKLATFLFVGSHNCGSWVLDLNNCLFGCCWVLKSWW